MNDEEIENYRKAGEIAKKVVIYAKSFIKHGMSLIEIADKIESKIIELDGKPAFPVNLNIDDMAAHYTPFPNDGTRAEGLLNADIGVHFNGAIADTAFSLDLANNEENKKIIKASEQALDKALEQVKLGIELWKIGETIQKTIESFNLSPIRNLCGHSLEQFEIHAGMSIPNCNNNSNLKIKYGAYAIEPFACNGVGLVYDGKPSGIYKFEEKKPIRDQLARQILEFIQIEYKTLPFCQRWIVKRFGNRSLLSLHLLEQEGIIKQYAQLIEKSHAKVSQSEHTFLVTGEGVEVTTR